MQDHACQIQCICEVTWVDLRDGPVSVQAAMHADASCDAISTDTSSAFKFAKQLRPAVSRIRCASSASGQGQRCPERNHQRLVSTRQLVFF